jgi:lysophospholipase L1-like esterase
MKILALGDCNTRGIEECKDNAYPEILARTLNAEVVNLGHTMATTREGIELFSTVQKDSFDIIVISFGLTDSWKTFKFAPYILYYPDSMVRKFLRKIVKKYKKIGKKLNFISIFGEESVVPKSEYLSNIKQIIQQSGQAVVIILDTLPKEEESRNVSIGEYNELLDLLLEYKNVIRVKLYDYFYNHRELYVDKTHLNYYGYEYIAQKVVEGLRNYKKREYK